jgi:uncharacterized protein
MTDATSTPSCVIRDPFTLLYWLFFRPLALRRYAHSIHPDLDENLWVWKVRSTIGDNHCFQLLCRARWLLLAGTSSLFVALASSINLLTTAAFDWQSALLFSIGYAAGALLGDAVRWWLHNTSIRWLGWSLSFVLVVILVLPVFGVVQLNPLIAESGLSSDVLLFAAGLTEGTIVGLAGGVGWGMAAGIAFGTAGSIVVGVTGGVSSGMAVGVAIGVAAGVAGGVASGVSFGVAQGTALAAVRDRGWGLLLAVAFGVITGIVWGIAFGAIFGVTINAEVSRAVGVAVGMALGIAVGVRVDMTVGLAVGLAWSVVWSMSVSVLGNMAMGIAGGMAGGLAFLIMFLRLPIYLLWELPRTLQLSRYAQRHNEQAATLWHKQPIHYDEVIQLPLAGLAEHMAAIAQVNSRACREAFTDISASLRQQRAIPQALRLVLIDELRRCKMPNMINLFQDNTAWFPTEFFSDIEIALLTELRSICADAVAALQTVTLEAREHLLRTQADRLQRQRIVLGKNRTLGQSDHTYLRAYAKELAQWQSMLEKEANSVAQKRIFVGELPMGYSAGAVLGTSDPAFQGRDDLFRELEGLLINAPNKVTPLLLGQPRTGKTSVLLQLPQRLGAQVLPIYIDMERQSIASDAGGLLNDLVGEICKAARMHPDSISLPFLDPTVLSGDPYRVFLNWIDEVEQVLGERRWLLLALDEFNRIDEAIQSGRIDERIFAMLRRLIQHHRRVALALCGTFTLAECDPRWYEALKSVRTLPVSFLRPDEAYRVFTRPTLDFPVGVYSEAATARAIELTGGQPYLLHLLGATVVNTYNSSRIHVPLGTPPALPLAVDAINVAIPEVLISGGTCFMSIWQWLLRISETPDAAARLLKALASGQTPEGIGDPDQNRELLKLFCERDLLQKNEDGHYSFRVPLIGYWIRDQRRLQV